MLNLLKHLQDFLPEEQRIEDAELMRKYVGANVKVKAAGGIASFADAEKFVELGADRLGTSRLIKIMKAENAYA